MEVFVKYKEITKDQAKDSGLALVLILLLISFFSDNWSDASVIAIPVLVITMTFPAVFKPFAVFWLSLSGFLGNIMSKVLMTILYILIVTPIGLIRRMFGADPMQKKKWKRDNTSVFTKREYIYSADDMDKPY